MQWNSILGRLQAVNWKNLQDMLIDFISNFHFLINSFSLVLGWLIIYEYQ